MKTRSLAAAAFTVAFGLLMSLPGGTAEAVEIEALQISGSIEGNAAYLGLKNGAFYPHAHASLADYAASTISSVTVDAGERSRLSFEGRGTIDAVDRTVSFEVMRAFAEARIGEYLTFGLGRRFFGFGCGLVWNPVNGVDVPRNPLDRKAERPGRDAAFASLNLTAAMGFPLSISAQAFPPAFSEGVDVVESTVAVQTYAYLGGFEIGITADYADPSGEGSFWSTGAWGTVDLAGLVFGFETALRKNQVLRPDDAGLPAMDEDPRFLALLTASVRTGDFFVYAEGLYSGAGLSVSEARRIHSAPASVLPAYAFVMNPGAIGKWHAAAGFEWSKDDLTLGLAALFDIEEAGAAVCPTAAWALDDMTVISVESIVSLGCVRTCEYDFLPYGWTIQMSVEVYF